MRAEDHHVKVSCVIATRNRADLLARTLRSLYEGTRTPDECIVVDNASTDGTVAMLERDFPQVRVLRNDRNLFATIARNQGMREAAGDYFLMVDDDNEVDPRMTEELFACCESDATIGVAGPKMYYDGPDRLLLFTGAVIHPVSSRAYYRGVLEQDRGQYDEPAETEHIPNIQIIARRVTDRIGYFDERYRMTFSEADFPMRAREAGFKVLYWPRAVTTHLWPPDPAEGGRTLVFRLPMRAYYIARNRVVYMRRFSGRGQFAVFLTIYFPLLTAYYTWEALRVRDRAALVAYWRGTLDALRYLCTRSLPDYYAERDARDVERGRSATTSP